MTTFSLNEFLNRKLPIQNYLQTHLNCQYFSHSSAEHFYSVNFLLEKLPLTTQYLIISEILNNF